jgi:hypothetical protein
MRVRRRRWRGNTVLYLGVEELADEVLLDATHFEEAAFAEELESVDCHVLVARRVVQRALYALARAHVRRQQGGSRVVRVPEARHCVSARIPGACAVQPHLVLAC